MLAQLSNGHQQPYIAVNPKLLRRTSNGTWQKQEGLILAPSHDGGNVMAAGAQGS